MASIINDNTVSFLKFDNKSNALRDSILNTNINWQFNLSEETKINSEYSKSRRNSLQTKTVYNDSYNVYSSFNGLRLKTLKNLEYVY